MKNLIFVFFIAFTITSVTQGAFLSEPDINGNNTAKIIADIIKGIYEGLEIEDTTYNMPDCREKLTKVSHTAKDAFMSFDYGDIEEGIMTLTQAFGNLSYAARSCAASGNHMFTRIIDYVELFESIDQFMEGFRTNMFWKSIIIMAHTAEMKKALEEHDYYKASLAASKIVKVSFDFEPKKELQNGFKSDGKEIVKRIMTLTYEFLKGVKIINDTENIDTCKSSTKDMVNMIGNGIDIAKNTNITEGILTMTDSFVFLNDIALSCKSVGFETVDVIIEYKKVFKTPKIFLTNILKNLFFILSDASAIFSCSVNKKFDCVSRVSGHLVYLVFFSSTSR